MGRKAVFLDRDGTICKEVEYLSNPDYFELLPHTGEAIKRLNGNDFLVIIITNQAGISKGYFTHEDVEEVHKRMHSELIKYNARIDAVYYCPHHPDYEDCECRKPKSGLINRAAKDWDIDLSSSYCIGDRIKDISAGASANCKTILVLTGYGKDELKNISEIKPDYVSGDLYEAVNLILKINGIE